MSKLTSAGHTVYVLTRNAASATRKLPYPNIRAFGPGDWQSAIAASDTVINLAGEPIATRCAQSKLYYASVLAASMLPTCTWATRRIRINAQRQVLLAQIA